MARCKRRMAVTEYVTAGGTGIAVTLDPDTLSFTMRAADSAGAAIAFTVAMEDDPTQTFHFAAGEAYNEERLVMDQDLVLRVVAAAGVLEVIAWSG